MLNAMQAREGERRSKFLKTLQDSRMDWENVTNHLGCNVLDYAVEHNNISLVKMLLSCGVNINVQVGCGAANCRVSCCLAQFCPVYAGVLLHSICSRFFASSEM